eukprot:763670-Hanusia_phi.AAC.11
MEVEDLTNMGNKDPNPNDQKEYFVWFVKKFALQPGDFLERRIQDASARFSIFNLFTENLISLTLLSFPYILLVWAALISLSPDKFLFDVRLWDKSSVSLRARYARFSLLLLRDGSPGINVSGDAGLSMDGCFLQPTLTRHMGNQIVKEYLEPVAFNGWFLRNGNESPDKDMSLVMLETSMNGDEWRRIAVSKPYCSLTSDVIANKHQGIEMPMDRGGEIIVDFTSPWCTTPIFLSSIARLMEAFSLVLSSLFLWYGSKKSMMVLCAGFMIASCFLIGSGAFLIIGGECYAVALTEGLTIYVAKKARYDVKRDEIQFDQLWRRLSNESNACLFLRRIQTALSTTTHGPEEICQSFQSDMLDATITNQVDRVKRVAAIGGSNPPAPHKMNNKVFHSTFIEKAKAANRVFRISNLDQLYAQAVLVYPLFLRK